MMNFEFMKNFLLAHSGDCLLDSFRPPELKNVLFLLSRHDVREHEKFSSVSGEQMPVRLISASWAQKRLIPTF